MDRQGREENVIARLASPVPIMASWIWKVDCSRLLDEQNDEQIFSPMFEISGYKWNLIVCSRGYRKENFGNNVKLFLYSYNRQDIVISYGFAVINQKNKVFNSHYRPYIHLSYKDNIGTGELVEFHTLTSESNNLIVNNKISILCEIFVHKEDEHQLIPFNICTFTCDRYKGFEDNLNNKQFSDVQFKIGRRVLHAHKVILASKSPVFKAMFQHNMLENEKNVVKIQDASYDVMNEVLRYMYTNEVENLESMALDIMAVAEKYSLRNLKRLCELQLCKTLSCDNVLNYLRVAEMYNAKDLKSRGVKFIVANSSKIVETLEFKNFVQSQPTAAVAVIKALSQSNEQNQTQINSMKQSLKRKRSNN